MRILFVTPYPPSRIRARSYGFVTRLAQQHTVEVIALCAGTQEIADVQALRREGIGVTAIHEPYLVRGLRALYSLPSQLPLQVAFEACSRLRALITTRLQHGTFDLLHVEHVRSLAALPAHVPIPMIWDAVDCMSQLYAQGAQHRATRLLSLFGQREARRIAAYEREHLLRFRHVLVTSERERRALVALVAEDGASPLQCRPAQITVVPLGIDQQYFQPYHGIRQHDTIIFSGKMSFHANIAAVYHLVERILPLIWRHRPAVRLVIAGSGPPAAICGLTRDPRIEVTGYVPDLWPYIARAQVAVCPLPYAVGMQFKALEAMALGTPVVATSCVADGLLARADHGLLVADEPEHFATAVVRLMDDLNLWHTLAERGIAYISTYHNWPRIIKQLTDIYAQAVSAARRGYGQPA